MTEQRSFWTNPDLGLLIVRCVFGATFFLHGWHKAAHGFTAEMQMLQGGGLPGQLMYFMYVSELLAPVLIVLGVVTRLSAVTVIGTMIVIFYVLPFPAGLTDHGALNIESQLFFLSLPLALLFTGPGRYRIWRGACSNSWLA